MGSWEGLTVVGEGESQRMRIGNTSHEDLIMGLSASTPITPATESPQLTSKCLASVLVPCLSAPTGHSMDGPIFKLKLTAISPSFPSNFLWRFIHLDFSVSHHIESLASPAFTPYHSILIPSPKSTYIFNGFLWLEWLCVSIVLQHASLCLF